MEDKMMNSCNDHLTFDEMVDFACYDKFDDKLKSMASRVNSHLICCKECARVYNAIYATRKALDGYTSKRSLPSKVKFYAISALLQTDKKLGFICDSIDKLFDSIDISFERMKIKILDLNRVEMISNNLGLNFSHPKIAGLAKSFGDNNAQNVNNDSVLIDGKSRIKVDSDGSLTIEFDDDCCRPGTVLFLLPIDERTNSYVSITSDYRAGVVRAVFEDVEPGEYQLVSNIKADS